MTSSSSFSRASLFVLAGCAAACSAPGSQAVGRGPAERPAESALRPSGAAPLELGQIVSRARARFRSTPQGLSAEGAAHRIDLEGGAARIRARSSATAARRERERQVQALLEVRTAAEFEARRRALRRTLLEGASGELEPGGALTLATRSIARAGYECVNGEGHVRIAADGGAERAFETCGELWKNHEANAEQAFRFPERPGGRGDLVVRVSARLGAADAPPPVASDARGLVLGAAPEPRFVYGHGTWIDASGRRVPVPARWSDGHIELRVPAAVVEESGYPALLDPEVGPEIGTEPPVPVHHDVGFDPEIATDGAGYVVAFEDLARIRAVRVDARGNVLDLDWLDLSEEGVGQFLPSVAYGGGRYLFTWCSMYGARVSIDGVVQGTDDVRLADGSPRSVWDSDRNSLVWSGSHFLLAFHGQGVEGSLIGPDLALAAGRIGLSPLPNQQWSPRVVWTGESYLVAWTHQPGLDPVLAQMSTRAARVSAAGEVIDPVGIDLVSRAFAIDLASNGEGTSVLTWQEPSGENYLRSIASDGTPGERVAVSSLTLVSSSSVEGNGDGYLVTFVERSGDSPYVYTASGRLLDASGSAGPAFPIVPAAGSESYAHPLRAGQDYLVVYRNGSAGMRLVPVSRTGEVGESFLLSESPAAVSAATDGTDTLVVWTQAAEWPKPTDGLIRGRIYAAGGWRGEAFEISPTSAAYSTAVAWDGASYQVVWEEAGTHRLHIRAVAPDGTLGTETLLVEDECNSPTLARGEDGRFLLSYEKRGLAGLMRRVVSRLLTLEPSSGTGAGGGGGAEAGAGGSGGAEAGAGGSGGAEAGAGGAAGTGGGSSTVSATSGGNDGTDGTGDDAQCSFRGGADPSGHLGLTVSLFGLALVARRRGAASAQDARSRVFRR